MPSPKVPCPECGQPKTAAARLCGPCGKGKYERTPEIRRKMSESMTGLKRPYARGISRPEVAKKIAAAWTPEKREAARQRGLAFADDPEWRAKVGQPGEKNANYQGKDSWQYGSGFSVGMKKRLIAKRGGACEQCGSTDHLHVHHRDFGTTDHSEGNLLVLCAACHRALHRANSAST